LLDRYKIYKNYNSIFYQRGGGLFSARTSSSVGSPFNILCAPYANPALPTVTAEYSRTVETFTPKTVAVATVAVAAVAVAAVAVAAVVAPIAAVVAPIAAVAVAAVVAPIVAATGTAVVAAVVAPIVASFAPKINGTNILL
jgi:hypothetical protein